MAIGALCLISLPGMAAAQQEAFYVRQGVEYYLAVGDVGTGSASRGMDYNGTQQLPFEGCAVAQMRAGNDNGRVQTIAKVDGVTFELEWSDFHGSRVDMQGGIARDGPEHPLYVDGSRTHGTIQHPAVRAGLAAWGDAYLTVDGAGFYDPATGSSTFDAYWFVTDQGFRDDETGQILNEDGAIYAPGDRALRGENDREMHLRIESPGTGGAAPVVTEVRRPGSSTGLLQDMFPPQDHQETHAFPNVRFGGEGRFDIEMEAMAPEGDNALNFSIHTPSGVLIAQFDATPSFNQPFSASTEFPLERFGDYIVVVSGPVSMSQYSIRFTQTPPERFDLNLWWDNVTVGSYGPDAHEECTDTIFGEARALGFVPLRPDPPPFPWVTVTMTVLASIATLLVIVKMAMMSRAAMAHQSAAKD